MRRLGYRLLSVLFSVFLAAFVLAYIPASPTNSTKDAVEGGVNITDISGLHLQWYPNGFYEATVSYELVGADSDGLSQGALVHFSEVTVNEDTPPTSTPWIALVACDFNATNASQEIDIFTLARDKGAVSALLYSLYSTACVINPEYADPNTFDQVFDIFSTQSHDASILIEYQFGQIGSSNTTYSWYNSSTLNSSGAIINASIETGSAPAEPEYLFATLLAYNATASPNSTNTTNDSSSTTTSGHSTGLAMIILYAITGCVSALFVLVIVCGAVRAIRHPERYGRRRTGVQAQAQGLGRAILDTFPIVKFGGTGKQEADVENTDVKEMGSAAVPVVSETIGHETCPICIVDFEEGDDLRQLPCEGHHRFHQTCVDPWLLELSSSCPICRQDFLALKSMQESGAPGGSSSAEETPEHIPSQEIRQSRHSI